MTLRTLSCFPTAVSQSISRCWRLSAPCCARKRGISIPWRISSGWDVGRNRRSTTRFSFIQSSSRVGSRGFSSGFRSRGSSRAPPTTRFQKCPLSSGFSCARRIFFFMMVRELRFLGSASEPKPWRLTFRLNRSTRRSMVGMSRYCCITICTMRAISLKAALSSLLIGSAVRSNSTAKNFSARGWNRSSTYARTIASHVRRI
mmetsp:Transcript_33353/g.93588  ORF Transcript_33353/g.93588 Transcript_33353/m.93588 type:complete len:202 (+) Transcript_33353:243-848(+)